MPGCPIYFAPALPRLDAAVHRAREHERCRVHNCVLRQGAPGLTPALDTDTYDKRYSSMLILPKVAAGTAPFVFWAPVAEAIFTARARSWRSTLKTLYELRRDILILQPSASEIRNRDDSRRHGNARTKNGFHMDSWRSSAVGTMTFTCPLGRNSAPAT
jgi:hypothetical protein